MAVFASEYRSRTPRERDLLLHTFILTSGEQCEKRQAKSKGGGGGGGVEERSLAPNSSPFFPLAIHHKSRGKSYSPSLKAAAFSFNDGSVTRSIY